MNSNDPWIQYMATPHPVSPSADAVDDFRERYAGVIFGQVSRVHVHQDIQPPMVRGRLRPDGVRSGHRLYYLRRRMISRALGRRSLPSGSFAVFSFKAMHGCRSFHEAGHGRPGSRRQQTTRRCQDRHDRDEGETEAVLYRSVFRGASHDGSAVNRIHIASFQRKVPIAVIDGHSRKCVADPCRDLRRSVIGASGSGPRRPRASGFTLVRTCAAGSSKYRLQGRSRRRP